MSRKINLLSVSGGKDSTALLLHAIERGVEFRCCFADTGHEHPDTYEYLSYLESALGITIERAKADFTARIEAKREYIKANWFDDLTQGRPGKWVKHDESSDSPPEWEPENPFVPTKFDGWKWQRALPGFSEEEAQEKVEKALAVLVPTGNPFLDMCIWKGRFPSTKGRFCTDELKTMPITDQIVVPILKTGRGVRSWQGIRADESPRRRKMKMHERIDLGVWVYRPLLHWSAKDVFDTHKKHGIKPNPLYLQGMNRVGCMPCIMSRKGELAEISRRFPEVVERLREWERVVSSASKRGSTTFFDVRLHAEYRYNVNYRDNGIDAAIRWSKTQRGGRQYDLFLHGEEMPSCSSNYGLCEVES